LATSRLFGFTCNEITIPVSRYNVHHLVALAQQLKGGAVNNMDNTLHGRLPPLLAVLPAAPLSEVSTDPSLPGTEECNSQESNSSSEERDAVYSDSTLTMTDTDLILHDFFFPDLSCKVILYADIENWIPSSLHYLSDMYAVPAGLFHDLQSKIQHHVAHDKCIYLKVRWHSIPVLIMPKDFGKVQLILSQNSSGRFNQSDDEASISMGSRPPSPQSAASESDSWAFLDQELTTDALR